MVGGAALLGIFAMYWGTSQYQSFPYEGGMFLLALLTALVIGVTVHPGSQLRPCSGGSRCGGWGSAPTPSTSGTTRSSS